MHQIIALLIAVLCTIQVQSFAPPRFAQNRAVAKLRLSMMAEGGLVITAAMVPTVSHTQRILEYTLSSLTYPHFLAHS